jgi:HPt (histidine-containing phosphotransfer) domain-containing protein
MTAVALQKSRHVDVELDMPDAVLDFDALDELRRLEIEAGGGLMRKVLGMYARTSVALVDSLVNAIVERNGEGIVRAAHSLRSSSANVGALDMAGLCTSLETMVEKRRFDAAQAQLPAIEREHARVSAAIEALRAAEPGDDATTRW